MSSKRRETKVASQQQQLALLQRELTALRDDHAALRSEVTALRAELHRSIEHRRAEHVTQLSSENGLLRAQVRLLEENASLKARGSAAPAPRAQLTERRLRAGSR